MNKGRHHVKGKLEGKSQSRWREASKGAEEMTENKDNDAVIRTQHI